MSIGGTSMPSAFREVGFLAAGSVLRTISE